MKKTIISTMLTAGLLFSSISVPPQVTVEAATTQGEIVYGVNFRTAPSTSGQKIRMLKRGETVEVVEKVNSYWYKVRDKNGRVGYVSTSSKYIKTSKVSDSGSSSSKNQGQIVSGVNFRSQPSTSGKVIRMLKRGEVVTIQNKVNSYWYQVRDKDGRTGYISTSSKYINTSYSGSSSGSSGSGSSSKPSNPSSVADKFIDAGMKYLGTPYEFGSSRSSTRTFDCSDFVRRAYHDATGTYLPTDSRKQADHVKKIGKTSTNWKNLKRGDLMFFMDYKGTSKSSYSGINKSKQRISHVSIYLGNGKMLHTYSKKSGGVRTDSIAGKHWEYRFVFGGSPR